MDDIQFQRQLLRRLDVLINLQLHSPKAESAVSTSSKIGRLAEVGLRSSEIASIIGKPINYVTAVLTTKKTRAGKRKSND